MKKLCRNYSETAEANAARFEMRGAGSTGRRRHRDDSGAAAGRSGRPTRTLYIASGRAAQFRILLHATPSYYGTKHYTTVLSNAPRLTF